VIFNFFIFLIDKYFQATLYFRMMLQTTPTQVHIENTKWLLPAAAVL